MEGMNLPTHCGRGLGRTVLHQQADRQTGRGNVDRQTFAVCELSHW